MVICENLDVPVIKESKEKQWDARFDWVQKEKDIGNEFYKVGKFQEAIDQYLRALCGITGFGAKQEAEDKESIEKDLKSPIVNNIAICLIKQGRLDRALYLLDLIVGGKTPIDPANFKAWKRQFDVLLSLGRVQEAQKVLQQAERNTETLSEKTMITSLYRELAKASDSQTSFSQKPPDFTKLNEMMLEYEYEHLQSLSNLQWVLYPFSKTYQVLSKSCCRKQDPIEALLKQKRS